jgi:hypothetical protein
MKLQNLRIALIGLTVLCLIGGPAIAGGMLFTNSGYSHHSGILPGNVLRAFAAE